VLNIAESWSGGIEDLVAEANRLLPTLLPEDRAARPKDEVNARLVRHYTTQGLLAAPTREGREARYRRAHLLELLALRRLMADGLSGKALAMALDGRTESELAELALRGSRWLERLESGVSFPLTGALFSNPALDYIGSLRRPAKSLQGRAEGMRAPLALPAPAVPPRHQATVPPSSGLPEFLLTERRPQTVTRILVQPGLEVQVGPGLQWPKGEAQWEHLLSEVKAALVLVQKETEASAKEERHKTSGTRQKE